MLTCEAIVTVVEKFLVIFVNTTYAQNSLIAKTRTYFPAVQKTFVIGF